MFSIQHAFCLNDAQYTNYGDATIYRFRTIMLIIQYHGYMHPHERDNDIADKPVPTEIAG